ncbi:MAG: UbiA family prenyltransferase [Deltaproteobacteria bacterium]|nr:UbiA family prenyltransferase [Deltaproteobacteria bacterium]
MIRPGAWFGVVGLFAAIGRLHIVAIAALGTFTFGWLFSGAHLFGLAGLTALDWFLVNLLNRTVDLQEDRANGIAGTDFVGRHRRVIVVLGLATLVTSFLISHLVAPGLTPFRGAYHLLGLLYNWPILGRRLKELYFIKNTASALGFLITVFAYPLATMAWDATRFSSDVTWWTVAFSVAWFFPFEISYEVIYDLRDVEGDRRAGFRTYPVVHGILQAARIVDVLIALAVGILLLGYAGGWLPWRFFVMILAPLMQLPLYRRALRRGISTAFCVGLTWIGAGLLFVYHLWVFFGLPGVR